VTIDDPRPDHSRECIFGFLPRRGCRASANPFPTYLHAVVKPVLYTVVRHGVCPRRYSRRSDLCGCGLVASIPIRMAGLGRHSSPRRVPGDSRANQHFRPPAGAIQGLFSSFHRLPSNVSTKQNRPLINLRSVSSPQIDRQSKERRLHTGRGTFCRHVELAAQSSDASVAPFQLPKRRAQRSFIISACRRRVTRHGHPLTPWVKGPSRAVFRSFEAQFLILAAVPMNE